MGTGGSFRVGKAAGVEADHSSASSDEVKLYLYFPVRFHGVVLN
jgi:hypothetical protein